MASAVEPIAVVGMAVRAPSSADLESFWANLLHGRDCIDDLTDEQLLAAGEDPAAIANPAYVRARPLLPDADKFDARFFGLTPRDAEIRDPQHRIFLELAYDVLQDAGYDPATYTGAIGVFAGASTNRYVDLNLRSHPDLVRRTGELALEVSNNASYLTSFVSYKLGLTGPSVTLATACSTSLVAVHMACQSLRAGECDMAVVGGVEVEMPYGRGYVYTPGSIDSADGRCRPFDASAGGTVFGSGAGAAVLKRLSRAQEDRDHIAAVVLGSAVNNDGYDKVGFTAPGVQGQAACVAEALAVADVHPSTVSYVEAHATGTSLGDPIEIAGLTEAFRTLAEGDLEPGACWIGSVKSNVGHLGPAAGIVGFVKTALALQHEVLPPSIHVETPNPKLGIEATPFRIVTDATPWPRTAGSPRRAGVSSFGIGGTNAHVVLEEAPVPDAKRRGRDEAQVLVWSAADQEDELAVRRRLGSRLAELESASLADAAYTLHASRGGHAVRAARVAASIDEASTALLSDRDQSLQVSDGTSRRVVFAFPGQGSQYPRMARALAAGHRGFAHRLDHTVEAVSEALGVDLDRALDDPWPQALSETLFVQPLLFAVEYALAGWLTELGLAPDMVIGHSVGELVAAAVAGVFDFDDAVVAVASRARWMQRMQPGLMLAVAASDDALQRYMSDDVVVSARNSAKQVVLGGPGESIARVERDLAARGIACRRLASAHAFHTPSMEEAARHFEEDLGACRLAPPTIPLASAAHGRLLSDEEAVDPRFWARQVAEPVLFGEAADRLRAGPSLVLEVGPGTTLGGLLRTIPEVRERTLILRPTLGGEPRSERVGVLDAVASAWINGATVDWRSLREDGQRHARRISLPGYPYRRQRFWVAPATPAANGPQGSGLVPSLDIATPALEVAASERSVEPTASLMPEVTLAVPVWTHAETFMSIGPEDFASRGDALVIVPEDVRCATEVVTAVQMAGYRAFRVSAGDALELRSSSATIRPANPDDADALLAFLRENSRTPAMTVYALCMGSEVAGDLDARTDLGFYAPLALLQALTRAYRQGRDRGRFVVVTSGAVDVGGGGGVDPSRAMVTGLVRTAALELSALSPRVVDVSVPVVAEALARQLLDTTDEPVVALRGMHRWVPQWRRLAAQATSPPSLRKGGVYVITGGLGGLGLTTAYGLAATGVRPKVALIARRAALPSGSGEKGSVDEVLSELEALGAEARLYVADVSDPAATDTAFEAITQELGPISGVFHSAGVPGGGLLQSRSRSDADSVLRPKVQGTTNLLTAVSRQPQVDFVILYSSRAGVTGLLGSGDYAAANVFMDAAAQHVGNTVVTSIDWPAWNEVGMAARSTSLGAVRAATDASGRAASDDSWSICIGPGSDWVVDEHRVDGLPVLPGAGHIDLVIAAARACGVVDGDAFSLEDVVFVRRLVAEERLEIRVLFSGERRRDVRVLARAADRDTEPWVEYSRCTLSTGAGAPEAIDVGEIMPSGHDVGVDDPRRRDSDLVEVGPRWECVTRLADADGRLVALLELPDKFEADLADHPVHPALLDRATGMVNGRPHGGLLPFGYRRVELYRDVPSRVVAAADRIREDSRSVRADIRLWDLDGRPVASIEDFTMRAVQVDDNTVAGPSRSVEPATLDDAIVPAEGVRQLLRIIASGIRGQVAVLPPGASLPGTEEDEYEQAPPVVTVPDRLDDGSVTPDPTDAKEATPAASPSPETREASSAGSLSTPNEQLLQRLWVDTLGIETPGLDDDYFEVGGDSLTAVQLVRAIRDELDVDVAVGTLFDRPTIRLLAAELDAGESNGADARR